MMLIDLIEITIRQTKPYRVAFARKEMVIDIARSLNNIDAQEFHAWALFKGGTRISVSLTMRDFLAEDWVLLEMPLDLSEWDGSWKLIHHNGIVRK